MIMKSYFQVDAQTKAQKPQLLPKTKKRLFLEPQKYLIVLLIPTKWATKSIWSVWNPHLEWWKQPLYLDGWGTQYHVFYFFHFRFDSRTLIPFSFPSISCSTCREIFQSTNNWNCIAPLYNFMVVQWKESNVFEIWIAKMALFNLCM